MPALVGVLALSGCAARVEPGDVPGARPTVPTTAHPAPPGASDRPPQPVPEPSVTPAAEPTVEQSRDPAATGWASRLPAGTRQVIRTISTDRWCRKVHCTLTQAWTRSEDGWGLVREFRSSIGPRGWGKRRMNDGRTPEGVFRIKTTFSTTTDNPGRMPWRRRLPTSNVTDELGPHYNTWLEEAGRTNGDRPSMRWGFVVDYNFVRLRPGAGTAPVQRAGSGIFYHTSSPGKRWAPSEGCTQVGDPRDMHWLLTWLQPDARPRVVQNL